MAATEAARERAQAEADVQRLQRIEEQTKEALRHEATLLAARRELRRDYNAARDAISARRAAIAQRLESQAGEKVRITVRKNADKLAYQQVIEDALKGIGVKQHDAIIESLTSNLRPGDLAAIIEPRNYDELERTCRFGSERTRKILDGLKQTIDPLTLETIELDDEITIELDVGTKQAPVLKDASKLSRGQKCTALLPLLLARRDAPIVIDQPEDNLDNHFIFNTVVETIVRMKPRRQMVFITHNANIPVLAEADLIIVLDSDGRTGYVKKSGSLDECKLEIIDLLEGGQAAFDLRRKRYESK
jgi:ATPase subunit of ABC transporter with duplicated ATPase domains